MLLIDNKKHTMTEEVNKAIKHSEKIDIAAGYFFISGFSLIRNSIEKIVSSDNPDHKIRILTSPYTDRPTKDALLSQNESEDDIERIMSERKNQGELLDTVSTKFKNELEHMTQTADQQETISLLSTLLKNGKVEIKVYTRTQLHAKLYMFKLDEDVAEQESIIGSSNFSFSGFKSHAELNLSNTDNLLYDACQEWFNDLWDDPTTKNFTREIAQLLDNSWIKIRTPKDVAKKAAVIESLEPSSIETGRLELFDFQKTAVKSALRKLHDHECAIISDVVGTGKTYVGAGILIELLRRDVNYPLIICPARLIDMWKSITRQYNIPCKVLSSGKLNQLENYTYCDAILIDESHGFKNHKSMRHRKLLDFMEDRKGRTHVVMLTATPISNTVMDLKNQLKLFPVEIMEKIPVLDATVEEKNMSKLDTYFAATVDEMGNLTDAGHEDIRELLRYILIRRTREMILRECDRDDDGEPFMLRDGERKYFPEPTLSNAEYDIESTYDGKYLDIESELETLQMARYSPGDYLKAEYKETRPYSDIVQFGSLAKIVKISLLKRLESSIEAFSKSIDRYLRGHRKFLEELERGNVLIGKEFQKMMEKYLSGDDEEDVADENLEEALESVSFDYKPEAFKIDEWSATINNDIAIFERISELLGKKQFENQDDKLHKLQHILEKENGKVLIFTESAVTARYIYNYLDKKLAKRIEWIDSSRKEQIDSIIKRFAPKFNDADYPPGEQIEILISTDILSEGQNLQSCGFLINYDFHWNPVRLIQRNGRIDRLGSDHRAIRICNFLTTPSVESSLNLRTKVRERIATIRKIMGVGPELLEVEELGDPENVCDIYEGKHPVKDGKYDDLYGQDPFELEELARTLRSVEKLEGENLAIPDGIRAVAGTKDLLITFTAESGIEGDGIQHEKGEYTRSYVVSKDKVSSMRLSSVLKKIIELKDVSPLVEPEHYNDYVNIAWKQFREDMKSSIRYIPKNKYQTDIDSTLAKMQNVSNKQRILVIRKFVISRMMKQKRPYQDLKELSHEIRDHALKDEEILEKLEKIMEEHKNMNIKKTIRKPRIRYSIMV